MTAASIRAAHLADLDQLLALYRRAIPARERKPDAAIRAMAASPVHRVEVAELDGRIIGFLLLYREPHVALLEYMATDEDVRGQGLGAELYRRARGLAHPAPLLIEVESDEEASPDQVLRRRRIGFYRRLGCREIEGFDYILPLSGEGAPPRMKLLIDGFVGPDLFRQTLQDWLCELYSDVYGLAPHDPRLETMCRALPLRLRLV